MDQISRQNDVHTPDRNMLNQLDELDLPEEGKHHQHSVCNHLLNTQNDMIALESSYKKLESRVSELDERQCKLEDDVKGLHERLDAIETKMVPKETDDSKTHSTAVSEKSDQSDRVEMVNWSGTTDAKSENEVQADIRTVTDNTYRDSQQFESSKVMQDMNEIKQKTKASTVLKGQFEERKDPQGGNVNILIKTNVSNMAENDISKGEIVDDTTQCGAVGRNDENSCSVKFPLSKSLGAMSRPNFRRTQQHKVDVVKQDVKLLFDGERHWRIHAQLERNKNRALFQDLQDIHVIICVDISGSMAYSNGWTESKSFLTDYLTGLENMSQSHKLTAEHVAVITFGHETCILSEYTTRYDEVRRRLGK